MNHGSRIEALRTTLDSPLLVSRLPNLRYLTGFTGSNGYLLVDPAGSDTFVTDGRYGEMAEGLVAALPGVELVVYTSGMWDVLRRLATAAGSVALEEGGVTWEFADQFASETGVQPGRAGGAVEELRRTKSAEEIAALGEAAAAGDSAFAIIGRLAAGADSEVALGWALIDEMRARGADAAGWEAIVAAGAGASIPHYRSGRASVGRGLLLLDYGCVVDGYHSDMSRTVWLEGEPDHQIVQIHGAVLEAQEAGLAAIAAGVSCGDVDEAARAVLRAHGYEEHFLHSTGHGVGLEIHEAPWVRRGNDDLLREGDVVTVEPGVYLPGVGGVRIEDMAVVTAGGCEVLTRSPKGLIL